MRNTLFYLSLLCVVILFLTSCQPDTEEEVVDAYTIEQFLNNESVFGGSFSPDNSKLVLTSNKSGIYNVYTVSVSGGEYTPVTESDSASAFVISFFPEDERILFSMDNNGDEISHLFVKELNGEVKELTPEGGKRAIFYGWAHDGTKFFYGYNQRDDRLMDVYEMNVEDYTSKMIFQNDESYGFGGISKNNRYMALTKPINTNDSDLFLYDFENEQLTQINQAQASHSPQDFDMGSEHLYYLTDAESEFASLMKYNILSEEVSEVYSTDWDVSYAYFSHEGTYLIILTNEDAQNVISMQKVETGESVSFPEFASGDITNVSISRDEEWIRFYVGGSGTPSDLYVYNINEDNYTQITDVLNPDISIGDLVEAEVVRYKSFDDLEIPAIYYEPLTASADNPVPALVWVHGGPGGQSRQSYSPLYQYLVNHGYAVLAVNNRGSSGYGKTFYQMDDQNHGEKDLQDCVHGKYWLMDQPQVDQEKIGIIGGSYGGFMVMAALTSEPEAFDVGINLYGVTNWIRTLKSIPPWWESFKDALYQEMGNPYSEDSVRLYRISPLFHAENVTKPLMVLQGAQDPRVLKVESDEIVNAVKNNGVPVEYVLFDDEGHGFQKKKNQIEAYSKILAFLDQHLKNDPPLAAMK